MLPPGHIAAGYIVSELFLRTFHFDLTTVQTNYLILCGMFFGFAPDLDFFIAFAKTRKFIIDNTVANHRKFISHAPILWLLLAAVIFVIGNSPFVQALAVIIWACSWMHFILDTEWGIMWFWPFSTRLLPLSKEHYQKVYSRNADLESDQSFFQYWWIVVKNAYFNRIGLVEISIVIIALAYFIINHF